MTIGYAAGAFDLFHIGHLNILREAKQRCDHLIAGVVSDEMLELTKGRAPIIPLEERMEIVSHISYVDQVHPETVEDKLETWEQLHFDVFFKGDDWKGTDRGQTWSGASRRSAWRWCTSRTPATPPAPSCAPRWSC
ncbi:Glycerol-3-phosphate cytidylyltransferase [Rothia kristinae]|nr:Glycerol-3-phosphate cytidylyltransferase [Rothia kristinae]